MNRTAWICSPLPSPPIEEISARSVPFGLSTNTVDSLCSPKPPQSSVVVATRRSPLYSLMANWLSRRPSTSPEAT